MRFLILQWLLHVNCPCLAYYADVIQCVCVRVTLLCSGGSKVMSESQLIDLWERIDAQVGELLEGCEPLPPPPMTFDPTNDITFDEQKLVSFPPSLFHSPSPFLSLSHTHTHTHTHTHRGGHYIGACTHIHDWGSKPGQVVKQKLRQQSRGQFKVHAEHPSPVL